MTMITIIIMIVLLEPLNVGSSNRIPREWMTLNVGSSNIMMIVLQITLRVAARRSASWAFFQGERSASCAVAGGVAGVIGGFYYYYYYYYYLFYYVYYHYYYVC